MNKILDSLSKKKFKNPLRLSNQADSMVLTKQNYHQRGESIMAQGILPYFMMSSNKGNDNRARRSFCKPFAGSCWFMDPTRLLASAGASNAWRACESNQARGHAVVANG
jgi:hypothetical protein